MKNHIAIAILVAGLAACPLARAFDIPGLPKAGHNGAAGADVGTLFNTYIQSYSGMLAGQAAIAGALDLTEEQQKLTAEAENIKSDNGKKLDATQKIDGEAQKKINEKMASSDQLDPEKKKLIVKGTAAYAVGTIKLVELVKQAKNMKKLGIMDITNLPKFKVLQTVPGYVANVATVLPNYMKFLQKIGAEPDPSMKDAMLALGKGPE